MRFALKLFILILIFCPVFIHAVEISDDLQAQMQLSQPNQLIPVWIELPKVVHGKQIISRQSSTVQTRAERYKTVLSTLKNSHATSQQSLLGYLNSLQSNQATNIKPHWMVNLIEAELTSTEIEKLANRNDIKTIYSVPQLITIQPELVKNSSPKFSAGVESNLTYINAPTAWGMGFTGVGSVVCSFDTGVDGEHPALKGSWKGASGDSLAAWYDPAKNQLAPHHIPDCGISGCNTNHGTHTMGTMVGVDTLTGDTVGVAPSAKWISAAVIDIAGTSIIDGFEWAADPDRNPNTIDDVPDVINHSWGIPGLECENLFYDLIDNSEALGIVNIFAAGNEGTMGTSTIRNPANRANDSLDCFAVGNINHLTEAIVGSSSRGPSICPLGAIKPNVSAPGSSIRSTIPNGLYGAMTGTSMAAPHVSGLVALLRQKNPNATVDEIKTAILISVNNMGQAVPNNNIGWGRIDCVAALNALSAVNALPNLSLYTFDHPQISAGDTVIGTIVLQNSGATVSSVTAVIVGTNTALQVLSGSASFGTIAEGDTVRAGSNFEVVVSDTTSVGSFLSLDVELSGAGYIDTVKIYYIIEPKTSRSFVTHNVGNIEFSLTNFGTFGLGAGTFFPIGGSGFRYKGGGDDLFEGGLLIGQNFTNISDGIRNLGGEPDGDFQVMPGGDIVFVTPKPGVTQESFSRFSDSRSENPIGLEIEQKSFAFDNVPFRDLIILQYVITNRSGGALNNLYVGIYMDWDVPSFNSNAGGYELIDEFSWVASNSLGTLSNYRGIKVINPTTDGTYTELADSASYPTSTFDNSRDGFTELEKLRALSNGLADSEVFKDSTRDLVQIISAKINLSLNQIDTVTFAFIAGDSLADIQTAAMEASNANMDVVTDIDEISGPDGLPQQFSLKQNYPNPFNPSTSISFELPKRSDYTLTIYNLIGQKLFEQHETADAGVHSIVWDATEYASGMYLYILTTDSFSQSKKMLLLK